jgi:hypothetical protein
VSRGTRRQITLELEAWATQELEREAAERQMTPEALAAYAIAYYLADEDAGRLPRRTPPPGRSGRRGD